MKTHDTSRSPESRNATKVPARVVVGRRGHPTPFHIDARTVAAMGFPMG